jgi:hypothetical protein
MSDANVSDVDQSETVTPLERRKVRIWAITVLVLFALAAIVTAGLVYKNRSDSIQRHNERMNPEVGEGGTKSPPAALPAGANPVRAQAGIYHRIPVSVRAYRFQAIRSIDRTCSKSRTLTEAHMATRAWLQELRRSNHNSGWDSGSTARVWVSI